MIQVYYLLKCVPCKWWRKWSGMPDDVKDLVEFRPCTSCHGPKKFKCPQCGKIIKALRVREVTNDAVQEDPNPR